MEPSTEEAHHQEMAKLRQSAGNIKFLCQNMKLLPIIDSGTWMNERRDILGEKIFPKYDIICLQEIFDFFNDFKYKLEV
jgi:hypothetical protein